MSRRLDVAAVDGSTTTSGDRASTAAKLVQAFSAIMANNQGMAVLRARPTGEVGVPTREDFFKEISWRP